MKLRKILVPVDFSEASLAGLDFAIDVATPVAATLVILFVAEPLYYGGDLGILLEEEERTGQRQLAELAARLKKKRGLKFRTILRIGTAHQVIVKVADSLKADLIVMATHGRGAFSHALMGSVAEQVARRATCPLLTVRWKKSARGTRAGSRRTTG